MKRIEMNWNKILMMVMFVVVLTIIFSKTVLAYGIAPSIYQFNYESGESKSLSLRILNTYQEDLDLKIKAIGDLADYITFDKQTIKLSPTQSSATINYKINMPLGLEPGNHEIKIQVIEQSDDSIDTNSVIETLSTLVQKVTIFVPYPGKYLTGTLYAQGTDVGAPAYFTTRLVNKGEEKVKVSGEVSIFGIDGEELGQINISEFSINSGAESKIQTNFNNFTEAGLYTAKVILRYADKELVLTDNFMVGEAVVDVTSLLFGNFHLGSIVKTTLMLENKWNQDLDKVSADIQVIKDGNKLVSSFKTNDAYISAKGVGRIEGFWDTTGLLAGPYSLLVNLNYNGKSREQIYDMILSEDNINVIKQSISGNVIKNNETKRDNQISLLILGVLILAGINIFVLTRLKKKNSNKSKKKKK